MLIAEFLPFLLMNYVPVCEKDDVPAKIRKEIRIRHIDEAKTYAPGHHQSLLIVALSYCSSPQSLDLKSYPLDIIHID